MTWTLWRGDVLIGTVLMSSSTSEISNSWPNRFLKYTSFLIPAAGAPIDSMMQMRVSMLDEHFFQHRLEPVSSYRDDESAPSRSSFSRVDLQPVAPEEARGVSPELQLRLLDDNGNQLQPRSINLLEVRYDPAVFALVRAGEHAHPIPAAAYVNGSVWHFAAAFDHSPAK